MRGVSERIQLVYVCVCSQVHELQIEVPKWFLKEQRPKEKSYILSFLLASSWAASSALSSEASPSSLSMVDLNSSASSREMPGGGGGGTSNCGEGGGELAE